MSRTGWELTDHSLDPAQRTGYKVEPSFAMCNMSEFFDWKLEVMLYCETYLLILNNVYEESTLK